MLQTKPHDYLEPYPEVAVNTGGIWCIQLLPPDPGARIMPPDHTHTQSVKSLDVALLEVLVVLNVTCHSF